MLDNAHKYSRKKSKFHTIHGFEKKRKTKSGFVFYRMSVLMQYRSRQYI